MALVSQEVVKQYAEVSDWHEPPQSKCMADPKEFWGFSEHFIFEKRVRDGVKTVIAYHKPKTSRPSWLNRPHVGRPIGKLPIAMIEAFEHKAREAVAQHQHQLALLREERDAALMGLQRYIFLGRKLWNCWLDNGTVPEEVREKIEASYLSTDGVPPLEELVEELRARYLLNERVR